MQRRRTVGKGGEVLKVEPSEVKKALVINPQQIKPEILKQLSELLESIDDGLKKGDKNIFLEIDNIVLGDIIGFKPDKIKQLQDAYRYLRERRPMLKN